jgi:hypothetical protein
VRENGGGREGESLSFPGVKETDPKSVGKFDEKARRRNGQFILSRVRLAIMASASAKFARLNGRGSGGGVANLPANEHEAEARRRSSPGRRLNGEQGGTETLLRGRKGTRYYLNHPRARNIVSNDSPPFLRRARELIRSFPGTSNRPDRCRIIYRFSRWFKTDRPSENQSAACNLLQ